MAKEERFPGFDPITEPRDVDEAARRIAEAAEINSTDRKARGLDDKEERDDVQADLGGRIVYREQHPVESSGAAENTATDAEPPTEPDLRGVAKARSTFESTSRWKPPKKEPITLDDSDDLGPPIPGR